MNCIAVQSAIFGFLLFQVTVLSTSTCHWSMHRCCRIFSDHGIWDEFGELNKAKGETALPPWQACLERFVCLPLSGERSICYCVADSAAGMASPHPPLGRVLRLAAVVAVAACACFPTLVSGIRKDIGFIEPIVCRSTVQGRHLISDDNGYVCSALSINPWSHCCPTTGDRFSCQGCKLDLQCCNSYEYCVSCCLNPSKIKKEDVLKLKVAKPVTAGTYTNVFDFCMGRCRHSSASVVHENAYASDFHHCFSVQQNSSGSTESSSVSKLLGINVVVGRPRESCSLVCKVRGQSCVPSRLSVLNKCEILQKYMRCKSGCFPSLGPDQPAEVVDEAPTSLNPGACLYMQMDERLTCDGSHQHTRRLCPCA